MGYEPQRFTAPDGTEMVVMRAVDFERLRALAEDAEDVIAAEATLARIAAGEGTVPGEVLDLMLDKGLSPVAAWRRYRGISQAELARRAGLSQVWVSRIEAGGGHGTPTTRQKLAAALEAPVWALETMEAEETEMQDGGRSTGKGAKYAPLLAHLRSKDTSQVSMRHDEIAKLVGGLPKSASVHREWWANHEGNSQAQGWLPAKYIAEPDMPRRVVVFRRFQY
jgi:transcriptional regulator with XRE-family HTH domain